jgi:7-cyano-7-deazaguanine synthase in queuosine biosynthesis
MKILILYSGGLDSLIMHHYAKIKYPSAQIIFNYYDMGQEYNFKEMAVLPSNVTIRKLEWLNEDIKTVGKENTQNIMIPGRNLVLAIIGACQELPDEIWMGALQGEVHNEATDKNYEFLNRTNNVLSYVLAPYGVQPVVRFPLADAGFGKFEATKWYIDNGGDIEALLNSSSCLTKEATNSCDNCGSCIVCLRRWGIFSQLGLHEEYIHHPITEMSDANRRVLHEMVYGTHYDEYRKREILPALEHYAIEHNTTIDSLLK